jgi:hypothetical protein
VFGRSVPGWGVLDRLAQEFGAGITSTYRPGDDGNHGRIMGMSGRAHATDYAGGDMLGLAKAIASRYGSKMTELFHTPLGFSIKNGQKVPWFVPDHYDHVHAAFRRGGRYGGLPFLGSYHQGGVAPREGLAHVTRGERMTPAGGGIVLHAEIDLGRGVKERFRLEFDERGRQQRGSYNAGVLPA